MVMVKKDWRHTYTETDFIACLLLHGWGGGIEYVDSYWRDIDRWFEQQWPDRWDEQQQTPAPTYVYKRPDYEGQMEFKIQFFSWLRDTYQKPYTAV